MSDPVDEPTVDPTVFCDEHGFQVVKMSTSAKNDATGTALCKCSFTFFRDPFGYKRVTDAR